MTPAIKQENVSEVIIIGSGPAAHTAAIYSARANLSPILFEGFMAGGVAAGGQLTTTTEVENYPGFPTGISGPDLTDRFRAQSIHCGTTIITETVESVDLSKRPFIVRYGGDKTLCTKTLIIATGATAKRLDIDGCEEYWQKGVSACAVCDGALPIFRNKELLVLGGGDSAMEEATHLTKFATTVWIIHRRDELRASKVMQDRAFNNPKIKFLFSHGIDQISGDGRIVKEAIVRNLKTNETKTLSIGGLFFAIGHVPSTEFLNGQLATDTDGYILTELGSTITSIPGVFAAGDVQDKKYRQAITAAGSGCMAALDSERFLNEHHDQE